MAKREMVGLVARPLPPLGLVLCAIFQQGYYATLGWEYLNKSINLLKNNNSILV